MHDELVNNAAALRAWDAQDIGEALVQAVDRTRRHVTLSPWPPIFFEGLPRHPHRHRTRQSPF
jgi:hypothetical protein